MPGLDGGAVLAEVARDATVAARHAYILCTAFTTALPQSVVEALAALGGATLHKPFKLSELFAAVEAASQHLACGE
jgi:CheY-like chemotaxis protein